MHGTGVDEAEEVTPGAAARRHAGNYWLPLAGIVVVGAVVRLFFAITDDSLTNDSTAYLEAGRNLLDGNGFTRNGSPELHFPPVTAVLLGGFWKLLGDPNTALEVSTVLTGLLVLLPLAAIGRRLGGDRAGLVAAGFGALAPGLAAEPALAGGGSEGPYLLFVLTAIWTFSRASDVRTGPTWPWAAATGVAIGFAYLTRPEAMFIAAGLGLLIVIVAFHRARGALVGRLVDRTLLTHAAAYAVALLVVAVPYVSYLHAQTGSWSPTAKSQDASIEAWRAVADGDRHSRDQVLYELDETGFQFAATRDPLLTLAKEDPSGFAGIVRINAGNLAGVFTESPMWNSVPHWRLLPLPLVALGLWTAWRRRRSPTVIALLGAAGASLLTGLTFFVLPRYLLPAAAAACVLAAVGVASLRTRRWQLAWLGVSLVALVAPYVADIGDTGGLWDRREQAEHEIAGEWIAEHSTPGERVMTRSMVVAFFAVRETVAMPYANITELVAFARHHGVTYIVMDEFNLRSLRPQFASLFADNIYRPDLEIAHEFTYRGRLTRIFTLDPPVNERSDDAPGLGFVGDG